jgi:hypothetical protein
MREGSEGDRENVTERIENLLPLFRLELSVCQNRKAADVGE